MSIISRPEALGKLRKPSGCSKFRVLCLDDLPKCRPRAPSEGGGSTKIISRYLFLIQRQALNACSRSLGHFSDLQRRARPARSRCVHDAFKCATWIANSEREQQVHEHANNVHSQTCLSRRKRAALHSGWSMSFY